MRRARSDESGSAAMRRPMSKPLADEIDDCASREMQVDRDGRMPFQEVRQQQARHA